MKRKTALLFLIFLSVLPATTAATLSFGTSSDWDNAVSQSYVQHSGGTASLWKETYSTSFSNGCSEWSGSGGAWDCSNGNAEATGSDDLIYDIEGAYGEWSYDKSCVTKYFGSHTDLIRNSGGDGYRVNQANAYNGDNNQLIFQRVGPNYQQFHRTSGCSSMQTITLERDFNGYFRFYYGGSLVGTTTDSTYTSGTEIRLHPDSGSGFTWDNFDITTMKSDTGGIITSYKSFSSNRNPGSLSLENVQSSLNGQSATVYVESSNGEISDPINLNGGGGPYSVTGISNPDNQFRLDIDFSTSDSTSAPSVSGFDLTGNSANAPPNNPSNEDPNNGADPVSLNPSLNVGVSDPDGDSMDVTFHVDTDNDGNHEYTDTDFGVGSGGTASTSLSSLAASQVVDWYVVADDGSETTTSSEWSFTTVGSPDTPSNPSPGNGAVDVSRSKNLQVDVNHPDNLDMNVDFYMDGSYIGGDTVTGGSGTASYSPSLGYSEDHSWSVDVDTQGYSTSSSGGSWSFETEHDTSASLSGPSKSPASIDPTLSATVSHSDSAETVTVDFINTDNGNTFCSGSAGNGDTVTCDTSGSSFGSSSGTTYNWRVELSGGRASESWNSGERSFTTISDPQVSRVEPSSNSGVSTNQNLVVDVSHPDGKNMNVEFLLRQAGESSFNTVDTKTDVSGQVSANPSLDDGTDYEWRTDVDTVGYSTSTLSSVWSFTTNYVPSVSQISEVDASDDHAFDSVSAIVSDQDGDDDIVDADMIVDGGTNPVEYNYDNIDRSYGNSNQANVTFGRVNVGDGNWDLEDTDITIQGIDSDSNTGSSTITTSFPNHAPTTDSNFSYSDDPQAHAFTLNVDAQDVDNGAGEIDSCTVEHRLEGGSSTTESGSLNQGETATCSFTIDDSYSGYDKGDNIEHRVTFTDLHGKTVTTSWAVHTIPNTPPSATDLRPEGDNVTYEPVLNATYNDPDGDSGNLTFYNTTSGEEFGTVNNLEPGQHGTVDTVGELSPGTTYNFTVEASDGLNATNTTENFTTIYRPDEPYDPFPENDAVIDTTTRSGDEIAASVEVVQDDGHTMNVNFVNASDDSSLGIDFDVESGSRAKLTNIGNELRDETNTTYRWYAKATDQVTGETVRSDTFEFRTVEVGDVIFDVMQGDDGDNMDITGDSNNGWSSIEFEITSSQMDPIPAVRVNETATGDAVKTWTDVDNNSILTVNLEQGDNPDWDLNVDSEYEYFIEASEGPNVIGQSLNHTIYTYNVSLDWNRAERYYNVYQYDIYRAQDTGDDLSFDYGSGNYDLVGSLPETSFNDSGPGLETGTFCWKVAASNPSGSSDAIPLDNGKCKTLN